MSLLSFNRGLVVVAALALASCGGKPAGPPGGAGMGGPAPVGVMVVAPRPVSLTVELTGRTSAFLVSDVRPQVSGIVQSRSFQEGGYVHAGQSLFQIDPAPYRAALRSAEANLAQAQATLTSARLKAERYKDLVGVNAVSRQDNEDAQAAFQLAQANVSAQEAAVDQARINLGYTRVTSPVTGRIGKSSVTPGALVTANQTAALATVQDLDKIYVDVSQSAADLLKLRQQLSTGDLGPPRSAEVTLTLDDGSTYPLTGHLEFADVTVDQGTGAVGLRAVFDNPKGVLLPGLFVRATLKKGVVAGGVTVPQGAISRTPTGQATVLVVGAGSRAEPRPVTLGQMIGDQWLVLAGLQAGDRVIVDGLQKVRPGAPVAPTLVPSKR